VIGLFSSLKISLVSISILNSNFLIVKKIRKMRFTS